MSVIARLEPNALRPEHELAELLACASGAGAVITFTGVARPGSTAGDAVDRLVLGHHPVLTAQSLEAIASEAVARFDVSHVHVVHRCGAVAPGEPIVFAAAASLHRRAAFDAADYLMDRLKTEAVFWKQEVGAAGSAWIEPTDGDHAARERWD
jgi:molybdopterin synthase catalytic subunit